MRRPYILSILMSRLEGGTRQTSHFEQAACVFKDSVCCMSAFKVTRDNNQFIFAVDPFFVGPLGVCRMKEAQAGKFL